MFKMKIAVKAATEVGSEETIECDVSWRITSKQLLNQVSKDPRLQIFCDEWLGFQYSDKKGNVLWLQGNKPIMWHDILDKSTLKLGVLYYPLDSSSIFCHRTLTIFYLDIRNNILLDNICTDNPKSEVEDDIIFRLAALTLQIEYGDWNKKTFACEADYLCQFRDLMSERFYVTYAKEWKDRVLSYHKQNFRLERNQAILKYLKAAQSLPMYGVSYFRVKRRWSKGNKVPHLLGLRASGINVYSLADRRNPIVCLSWTEILNISIETTKKLKNYFTIDTLREKLVFVVPNRQLSELMKKLCKGNKRLNHF